jgi:hypothetical protein
VGHVAEERAAHRIEVGLSSHDDEHGDAQRGRELVDVDDIEAADGNALEHHGPNVRLELAPLNQVDHPPRRVGSVALDVTAHETV